MVNQDFLPRDSRLESLQLLPLFAVLDALNPSWFVYFTVIYFNSLIIINLFLGYRPGSDQCDNFLSIETRMLSRPSVNFYDILYFE